MHVRSSVYIQADDCVDVQAVQEKLRKRLASVEVKVLHPPRKGKKVVVLDIVSCEFACRVACRFANRPCIKRDTACWQTVHHDDLTCACQIPSPARVQPLSQGHNPDCVAQDYTIFDLGSSAERPEELARPHLHEFMSAVYPHYVG